MLKLKVWTEAFQLSKTLSNLMEHILCRVQLKLYDYTNRIAKTVEEISTQGWGTFSRRNEVLNRLRVIRNNQMNWKLSSCSCGYYSKNYSYEHLRK